MKVALCLSGQPRFLETCYNNSMKPYILDAFSPDVFIHTWETSNMVGDHFINGYGDKMGEPISEDLTERMLTLYQPTKYIIEPQIQFDSSKWGGRLMTSIKSDHLQSMFCSIYKSNELKKRHEQENNFVYDWVIRIRFDMAIPSGPLRLTELDNTHLWVATGCFDSQNGYLDSVGYSSSKIIDIYSDTFNHLDSIADQNPDMGICGEYILRKHIDSNGIQVSETGTHMCYRCD